MPNRDIQQLKFLKEKLNNQKMSVLVGSGFSKNVSDIFPSWWELLFDMTYFLFQTEIEDSYNKVISLNSKSNLNKDEFINNKISDYISKIGYLDIVSEYIKRKGYREAITKYIEEKTPRIINTGKYHYLENRLGENQNKVKIEKEMLSQHKSLLQLPWNNIYTTNYDELLEFSNDISTTQKIDEEIEVINIEIGTLLKDKGFLNDKSNSVKYNMEEHPTESKNQEIQNDRIDYMGVERRIKDKERELLQLRSAQTECITLVKSSEDLSIKRNKNIIKLHGSLRKEGSKYGFDGDIQMQYVIAREDYISYPLKHEAFTQLMRISLLQESFCLIGFSGDDTNFLEWIKWVREIIERGINRNDYKIYLISLSTTSIETDKRLFFENHKVYPISIMEDEVIEFMKSITGYKLTTKTKKSVIELFFHYLKGKHQVNISKATFEILQINKYKRSWDSIILFEQGKPDLAKIFEASKKIAELKKFNRLPSLNFAYSSRKHKLLFHSNLLIDSINSKHKNTLLNLIILAIKDSYLTPKSIWNQSDLSKIEESFYRSPKYIQKEFSMLMLRDSVLRRDEMSFKNIESKLSKEQDGFIYESILMSAFSLDFKTLKVKIESWNPSLDWVILKTGLLALFDNRNAEQFINNKLGNSANSCQEELYMLEMYSFLKLSIEYGFDKDLNEAISSYKHLGLTSISQNMEYLLEEANKNDAKIKRYGEGRFSIANRFTFSNDFTLSQKGLQFIQQMIETGFPISIANVNWRNPKECYPLFKEVFQYFPYPTIFYSLQFSEEKFIRRLGQDFAYSEKLQNRLDEIIRTLLNAYLDNNTPNNFKQSILYFSSELFIATDPTSWQEPFHKIWKLDSFKMKCFEDKWIAERTFTISSLPYLQDPKIITEIINSVLVKSYTDSSVEILFHLAKNLRLKKLGDTLQSKKLSRSIESLINLMHEDETAIFMVGNIYSVLNDSQKSLVFQKLEDIEFENIENGRLWKVLVYFSDGNKKFINRIKSGIIKNEKLFYAGFTDRGLSMGVDFISISRLSNPNNSKHITWTKAEANLVFKKIVSEFKKIENWLEKHENNFTSILHEMILLLEREESKIGSYKGYKLIYKRIQNLYNEQRGYDTILDGLVSTESSVVVLALNDLSILIGQRKSIEGLGIEVSTLMNKVLLQSDPSLEASLNYLTSWIKDENLSNNFRQHADIILIILKKYTKFELEEFDKPFVYEQLVDIANKLNSWGIQDEVINQWQKFEIETTFNNLRFRRE